MDKISSFSPVKGRVRSIPKTSPAHYMSKNFQEMIHFWASLDLD